MRKFGMGKQADQLVETMNRAAEQAVPEAKKLLVNAARGLSIDDAKRILTGPDDAATQYFRAQSEEQLAKRFLPIVARETKRLKLADYYNKFANRGVALGLVREEDANLDDYVTRKALDGLFVTVADEEKAIRADPLESGNTADQEGVRRRQAGVAPASAWIAVAGLGALFVSSFVSATLLPGGSEAVLWGCRSRRPQPALARDRRGDDRQHPGRAHFLSARARAPATQDAARRSNGCVATALRPFCCRGCRSSATASAWPPAGCA